jgi:hypothetical protein
MLTRVAGLFAFAVLLPYASKIGAQKLQRDHGFHWQTTFPRGFEPAAQASHHPAVFSRKLYRFQKTGTVSDFFREMGRPDKFSRQGFTSVNNPTPISDRYPLQGSFKYEYRDGTAVYMTTQKMGQIFLALLCVRGKREDLLYK